MVTGPTEPHYISFPAYESHFRGASQPAARGHSRSRSNHPSTFKGNSQLRREPGRCKSTDPVASRVDLSAQAQPIIQRNRCLEAEAELMAYRPQSHRQDPKLNPDSPSLFSLPSSARSALSRPSFSSFSLNSSLRGSHSPARDGLPFHQQFLPILILTKLTQASSSSIPRTFL